MAKVLVSFPAEKIENKWRYYSFYQGLIQSLERNGNEVFYMVANEFISNYSERLNSVPENLDTDKLNKTIQNIKPDLVIAFNNFCYKNLGKIVDCPFIVWGVDSVPFFSDKENLKKKKSRYIICGNNEGDLPLIKDYFKIKNVPVLRFATDVRSQKVKQDYKISFIGYFWDNVLKRLSEQGKITQEQKDYLIEHAKDKNLQHYLKKNKLDKLLKNTDVIHSVSSADRERVLLNLVDSDLKLFGQRWQYADAKLSECFINKVVYGIEDVSNIFNRSKLNFNMSHFQATDEGFSFRLLDIMASNGCLITDYKPGYDKLFGKYVKLPTFKYGDEKDARRVCEYLLTHEKERQKIVTGCHKAIDAEFRFEHRFKQITDLTGVKLISKKTGSMTQISASDFIKATPKPTVVKTNKRSLLRRIKDIPVRHRIRRFNSVYGKYFQNNFNNLIGSLSTLGTFVEKRFLHIESKLNNPTFLNPGFTAYHQFLNEQAYIAKVSKGLPPKKPGDKIRVVFLFQEASYWSSLKDLYENLKKDPKFEVFVIAVPVLTVPKLNTLELKQTNIDFLEQNNIDYIDARIANGEMFDPYTLKPDYVFVQIHFDRQRPMEYKTNIMGLYTKVCLVPHAFLLSASDNRELIYQTNYFRVFVPNEYHANVLSDVFHHDENIEIVGYPRFDMYKHKIKDSSIWKISKKENPKIKRIIWSPHWWAYGYTPKLVENIFKTWEYFYNLVQNNPDVELIVKPHPNLFNGLVASGFLSEDKKQKMLDDMNNLPNASVYMGGDYIDLFKTADLMVNNSISFLAEWLPSEKPMIFQDTERKFELNELAEKILDVYYHSGGLIELNELINELLFKKKDNMLNKRLKLLKNLKLITKESVSDTIKKSLKKNVD